MNDESENSANQRGGDEKKSVQIEDNDEQHRVDGEAKERVDKDGHKADEDEKVKSVLDSSDTFENPSESMDIIISEKDTKSDIIEPGKEGS